MTLDLTQPKIAYMIGFINSDGNLYSPGGNKGRLSIEIQKQDAHILKEIVSLVDFNFSIKERNRNTNFKEEYKSVYLRISDLHFREELKRVGIIEGKKFDKCDIPVVKYSEIDFWRGMIDGDGSLGLTSQGIPFISLVTNSENMAKSFLKFIEKYVDQKKTTSRNSRDGNFNIMLTKEKAQKLVSILYYKKCMCLNRKMEKSKKVLKWKRPANMKRVIHKKWTKEEDNFILTHSLEESIDKLKRTENSIKMRKWRMEN